MPKAVKARSMICDYEQIGDDLILYPDDGSLVLLNETAALIYKLLLENKTYVEISVVIAGMYSVSRLDAERDIEDLVGKMISVGVIGD